MLSVGLVRRKQRLKTLLPPDKSDGEQYVMQA